MRFMGSMLKRMVSGWALIVLGLGLQAQTKAVRPVSGPDFPPSDPKALNWPEGPKSPMKLSPAEVAKQPIRNLGPGVYEIGKVRIDQKHRSLSFPALINATNAAFPLEYFLVNRFGKTHESVLRTDVEPYHLQVGLLLLGAKPGMPGTGTNVLMNGGATNVPAVMPMNQLVRPGSQRVPGETIDIQVTWTVDGKTVTHRPEDLFVNPAEKSKSRSEWVFNGSRVLNGMFFAQMDGSIISLVTDVNAIINFVGKGHDNDKVWQPRTNLLPAYSTPVEVTLRPSLAK